MTYHTIKTVQDKCKKCMQLSFNCILIISLITAAACNTICLFSIFIGFINHDYIQTNFNKYDKIWLIWSPFLGSCISLILSVLTNVSAFITLHKKMNLTTSNNFDCIQWFNNKYMLLILELPSNMPLKDQNSLIITRCVFFMSLWDSGINLWMITSWIWPIIDKTYSNNVFISMLGVVCQIDFVSSVCWYLIITLLLIATLYYTNQPAILVKILHKIQLFGFLLCFIVGIVATFVIGYGTNFTAFGLVTDSNIKIEPWIKNDFKIYWNILYAFIVISMVLSIMLLLFAAYKIFKRDKKRNSPKLILKFLLAFVFVFVFTWIFPFIERTVNKPHYTLTVAHHIGLSIYGFGNGLVWFGLQWYGKRGKRNSEQNDKLESLTGDRLELPHAQIIIIDNGTSQESDRTGETASERISNNTDSL
eukprot:107338_1